MFLGPINLSKPWDSNGIDGCSRFLRKLWNLFWNRNSDTFLIQEGTATPDNLKSINKLIQKVTQDIEVFSYNTSISAFMICVGEFTQQKCTDKGVMEQLVTLLAPFAPHIAEELWEQLGHTTTVCDATWPVCDESYLKEDSETLSVSFNGKTRFTIDLPTDISKEDAQKTVLEAEASKKYLEGKQIVKVIVVPHRIINIVIK